MQRAELVDYQTYDDTRNQTREVVMEVKRLRRVHVPPCFTFLFENAATVRYQIQEIIRAERIVREADVQHELDTYNGVLGDAGELGCCLLIEIDDRDQRDVRLRQWRGLPGHISLRCAGGSEVVARFDPTQADEEKLSSVQYLKFAVGAATPVALICTFPGLESVTTLTIEQQGALAADLAQR